MYSNYNEQEQEQEQHHILSTKFCHWCLNEQSGNYTMSYNKQGSTQRTKYIVWHYSNEGVTICHTCYLRNLRRRKSAGLPTGRIIHRERIANMNKRIIEEKKRDEQTLIAAYVQN